MSRRCRRTSASTRSGSRRPGIAATSPTFSVRRRSEMTVTIKAKALEAFVADIFSAAGCSKEEGGRIGHYLVSANLSGHDSHGVVRVPRYASQKKNGTVVADVKVDVAID